MALLNRKDAAQLLGISERSLGRQRDALVALGAAKVQGGVTLYESDGLAAAYVACAGLQAGNADTIERLHRLAEAESPTRQQVPDDALEDDIPEPDRIPPWAESRAAREYWLSEKARLEVRRARGELVTVARVKSNMFELFRLLRDSLQRIAVLAPPELKRGGCDIGAMGMVLQRMITEILSETAKEGDRRMGEIARAEREAAAK